MATGPEIIVVTPTHTRFKFAENIVVDVKLEEIEPEKSEIHHYLNGVPFNAKAHPIPNVNKLTTEGLEKAIEAWVERIYDNPTGE